MIKKISITLIAIFLISCQSSKEIKETSLDEFEKLSDQELLAIIDKKEESNLQGKIKIKPSNSSQKTAEKVLKLKKEHANENAPKKTTKKFQKKYKEKKETRTKVIKYGSIIKDKITINDINFDAYHYDEGPSFRIVCEQPCEISEATLESKLKGARQAIDMLIDFVKSDVPTIFQPVDIHLTSDSQCGDYETIFKEQGYVENFFKINSNGGSYICLWEFDKPNIVLSPGIENSQKLESQNQVIHEYSHAILNKKVNAYMEDFVKVLSFYIAGQWDGNPAKKEENFPKLESACEETLNTPLMGKIIYDMCKKCNLEIADIPKIIKKIDELYYKGEGEIKYVSYPSRLSTEQLGEIVNEILGVDTEKKCGVDWTEA